MGTLIFKVQKEIHQIKTSTKSIALAVLQFCQIMLFFGCYNSKIKQPPGQINDTNRTEVISPKASIVKQSKAYIDLQHKRDSLFLKYSDCRSFSYKSEISKY